MAVDVKTLTENEIRVSFTLKVGESMLDTEENLLTVLNEVGSAAMAEVISHFDTAGLPFMQQESKLTSKGKHRQVYETPYGPVDVSRHVYQSSKGGKTFCPLESKSRMVMNATPRYAKIVSGKYARMGADVLRRDMLEANGRKISRNYVQKIGSFVAGIAQANEQEWKYSLPEFDRPVASVGVGIACTYLLMRDRKERSTMCGSLALYDKAGERLYTIYAGALQENSNESFCKQLESELLLTKQRYPNARYIGFTDGEPENREFLAQHTERQLIDFHHVGEYIDNAYGIIRTYHPLDILWVEEWINRLRHEEGAVSKLLSDMRGALPELSIKERKKLDKIIAFFSSHDEQMGYYKNTAENLPIDSGETESACRALIQQRLGAPGTRWNAQGASAVIALRSLEMTEDRWKEFWNKWNAMV